MVCGAEVDTSTEVTVGATWRMAFSMFVLPDRTTTVRENVWKPGRLPEKVYCPGSIWEN